MKKIVLLLVGCLLFISKSNVFSQNKNNLVVPKLEYRGDYTKALSYSNEFKQEELFNTTTLKYSIDNSKVKKRGSKVILDTLKYVDSKKSAGNPTNYITKNGYYSVFNLKGYPAASPSTGTDYLSLYQKFNSQTPTKVKGVGIVLKALNTTSSNVKVSIYGKKTKGGVIETLGEVTKSIAAGNPAMVYFNFPTDVLVADTFIYQVSPVTNGVDSIQVYLNGKYGQYTTSATASISGTTLTATAYSNVGFAVGKVISGAGILPGTKIIAQTQAATFTVDKSQTVSSTNITAETFTFGFEGATLGVYNVPTTGTPKKYQTYVFWNNTTNKPYETDIITYPIVEYTWDSNPTIDNKCLGTSKTVNVVGSNLDLIKNPLFNRSAFNQKILGFTKADKQYYHYISFAKDKSADQIDESSPGYSVSKVYTNDLNDTINVYEYLISYNAKTYVNTFNTQFLVSSSLVSTPSSQNATGNNADGKATVNVSGGFSPYTYSWTNSSETTNSITVAPGTYKPTIVDANQCSLVANEIVVSGTQSPKSTDKDFLTYSINGVQGSISTSNNIITLTLPTGTDLTNLTAVYTTSAKSSVTSGAATVNFTNPVSYTITAEDGTTKDYIVTVTTEKVSLSNLCELTSFTLGVVAGTINSNNIVTVTLPNGSSLTQVASFVVSSGATVKIGSTTQTSGVTANIYSADVVYEVTAQDGVTKKTYTVKVTVASAPVLGCKDLDNWKDGKNTQSQLYATDSTGYAGNGYFTGTGINYFQGLYEKFETLKNDSKTYKLNSVKYSFGKLVSGNDTNSIVFVGYLPAPSNDLPGKVKLFSKRVLVKTVVSNLSNTGDYTLDLSSDNLKVKGSFYAGIQFKYRKGWGTPNVGQDTIALYSNTPGAQGSTINSAYCMYKTSATDTVFDTIMPTAYQFSLGVYANVCDLSSAKDLLSFNFVSPAGTVSTSGNAITVSLPVGTNASVLSSLVATFTSSAKSTVKIGSTLQTSGQTSNNFTSPLTYTVTAEDGSTKDYTVTVTIEQAPISKSSAKDFLTYSINGKAGVIGSTTISVVLPAGTSLTNLTPTYTTSDKATVTSGANSTNFTSPVVYTITAEDGTTKNYTVTVTTDSGNQNNAADLLTFGFTNPNVTGVISGTNITVSVPYGTNIKSLVASFTASSGAIVKVTNIVQISGGSVVDYTAPVTVVVSSEDGKTIKSYIVTVTITPLLSSAKELLTFGFASPSAIGSISGNTVGLTVPFGTNVSALIANFTSSPNSIVRVGSIIQVSGISPNNFTSSVLYTVVAQDGSTKDYTVVVSISPQSGTGGTSAKEILSFGLLNPYINGSISGNVITISGQAGSDISKQQIYFSVSPGATLTLNGVVLTTNVSVVNFSNPVTVTVTATDGTKKDYVITVTIPKKNGKLITFFKFLEVPSATVTIDDSKKIITVHVPFGTSLNLTSVFGVSAGASVSIGGIIQASGASQISYAKDVNYVVTAEDGTTATYTIKVIVDPNTAGVEDIESTVVRIFPNPSNGAFTCASSIETYEIIVTDILGHSVYSAHVEPNGTGTHTFDVSTFGAGVYFATLQFEGTSKMFKLKVVK